LSKLSKLATGVRWGTVSLVVITSFQLVFMAVMARLLDPADFGLVAIANVALRFYSYFSQMGIAPALIQKKTLTDGDVRAALSISLGVSSLFFLLAVLTSEFIGSFFDMKSLALVMQVLALNFIVSGLSAISLSLMRRNSKFKALAIIEIISYVLGYGVVGIGFAYSGAGVWSLVAAFLSQMIVTAILSYSVVRFPIKFKHAKEDRKHLINYGGSYSIVGFFEFLFCNIDALIIGKIMGATTTGYYSRALLLANLPVQHPANILTKALFPIMSSVSNELDKQSISVQLSVLLVGSYAFAVSVGVYLASSDIVRVLLGDKWLESIPILNILTFSVGPVFVHHIISVTLNSMGELKIKMLIQIPTFVLLAILIILAAQTEDVLNIALAVVVVEWVRVCIFSWVIIRMLKIPVKNIIKIILSIVVVIMTTGGLIYAVQHLVSKDLSVTIILSVKIIFGTIGLGLGLFVSRYIVYQLPAVIYLADRMPVFAKIMRF